MKPEIWWQLSFESTSEGIELDELGSRLFDLGAQGTQICSSTELLCFFRGSLEQTQTLSKQAGAIGLRLRTCTEVPQRDWIQECREVWQPVQVGRLRIVPVLEGSREPAENEILLFPSSGFGTGHHGSTQLMLEFLQTVNVPAETGSPFRVLDLGTGSAILACAAAKLLAASRRALEIDAVDIDPTALENARTNADLNGLSAAIRIFEGTLTDCPGKYDCILANLYAEILADLEPGIFERLKDAGTLIISGIMAEKSRLIETCYASERWMRLGRSERDNWLALKLSKIC